MRLYTTSASPNGGRVALVQADVGATGFCALATR